jgi:3-dehydroquinate dehydratase-2
VITTIYIINGPNLNLLGKRNIDIYGSMPFEEYLVTLKKEFPELKLEYFQSNHEGFLIDKIQEAGFEKNTGIILNAGGLSHTSISLRDAVAAVPAPVVEVHISDIYKREPFRQHSYLTEVCEEHFIGKGLEGYRMAIRWLLEMLRPSSAQETPTTTTK